MCLFVSLGKICYRSSKLSTSILTAQSWISLLYKKKKKNGVGLNILHLQEAVNRTAQETPSKSMHKKAGEELGVFPGCWVSSMNNSSLKALKRTQLPGFPDN